MKLSKRYQVPISGRAVLCHDEKVQMASKKQGTRASAGSPIDFVLAAGIVRVQQDLISGSKFARIYFWGQLWICPGCRSQLPIPSVLYVGLVLKLSWCMRTLSSKS